MLDMARTARADVGPLALYADGYRELLAGLGYTPDGVVRKLWELGRLSDWMITNRLVPADMIGERFGEFSALCKAGIERPMGYRTLRPLVGHLRDLGVVPNETVDATATDELIGRFRTWMVEDRAFGEVHDPPLRGNCPTVPWRPRRPGQRVAAAEGLTGTDVHSFLLAETERVSVGSAKGRVAELRCLLRLLFLTGWTATGLAASIPPVAGWQDTALPSTLTRSQVEMIVAAHDTATAVGRRNHAIVLMLARLGLRGLRLG